MARTRSIERIEGIMEGIEPGSLRYQILQNVKDFKTSWIELGQSLYTVWKDKLYKGWGYSTLEAYTSKEIGLKKQTALKLLRSYYFLEKEEPQYLSKEYAESADAGTMPTFEAVDVLRLAKNKKLDTDDYADLRGKVFGGGKSAVEVKRDLTAIIKQREELEPEEARKRREAATVKRFLSTLKSLKRDIEILKLLPSGIVKEADQLIRKIESEI